MNFGGVKNNHDRMCVHTQDSIDYRNWGEVEVVVEMMMDMMSGYYDGPRDTRDPEEAFPYWKTDDPTLVLRCVPVSVRIDSRLVADPARAPLLRRLYRRSGRLIRNKCGPPLVRGKLNMEAWEVEVKCGGDCGRTEITITMKTGRVSDILLLVPSPFAPV